MGQKFSHEGVNSEHIPYDQYEQEEEKHDEVNEDYMDEDDTNVEPMFDYHGFDEGYNIDSLEDIGMIEFWNIRDEDICHFHFSDVNIAFEFYNRYVRTRGFSARKNRTRKSRADVLKLKNFVCHREGFKPQNNNGIGNFKKKPTPETRCGCSAMMEIRLDAPSGRWFISYFSDEHSHSLLDPRLIGLLHGHRFMSEADICHMINMEKGEISVGQIYRALANWARGYGYLFFIQRDIYNKIAKQRHQLPSDAYADLKYLEDQATNDPSLYFNHHVDADGTLRNLFWCDSLSRADYSLFDDVLAFDATYKRNKYLEGRGTETFDNDLDDHVNIEDDSLVYDENASYGSNEVL
ncbi:hypothetical protein AHAS_Ahas03G0362100 [Arachis hypogaea]